MSAEHMLIGNGWPHDEYGNPFLQDYGSGHACCTCGWVSNLRFANGEGRRAVWRNHVGLLVVQP